MLSSVDKFKAALLPFIKDAPRADINGAQMSTALQPMEKGGISKPELKAAIDVMNNMVMPEDARQPLLGFIERGIAKHGAPKGVQRLWEVRGESGGSSTNAPAPRAAEIVELLKGLAVANAAQDGPAAVTVLTRSAAVQLSLTKDLLNELEQQMDARGRNDEIKEARKDVDRMIARIESGPATNADAAMTKAGEAGQVMALVLSQLLELLEKPAPGESDRVAGMREPGRALGEEARFIAVAGQVFFDTDDAKMGGFVKDLEKFIKALPKKVEAGCENDPGSELGDLERARHLADALMAKSKSLLPTDID